MGSYSHPSSGWSIPLMVPPQDRGQTPGWDCRTASMSAGIVWPSSHWNKYFCSQIFLDEQTEPLSSAVSLSAVAQKQPELSSGPANELTAAAAPCPNCGDTGPDSCCSPQSVGGQKNFLNAHHCANCLYKINVRLVLRLCRGAMKIPVERKIPQTDMNDCGDLQLAPPPPHQQVCLQMLLFSDLGL